MFNWRKKNKEDDEFSMIDWYLVLMSVVLFGNSFSQTPICPYFEECGMGKCEKESD